MRKKLGGNSLVWVEGFEGLYSIDEAGRVISYKYGKSKELRHLILTKGYRGVQLYNKDKVGKTLKVHRLVAKHFLDTWDPLLQVNHIDGDKSNNHVNNLEMCTNRENMDHAIINDLRRYSKGSMHGCSKLSEKDIIDIRFKRENNFSVKEICEIYNIRRHQVWRIVTGRSWRHVPLM